MSKTRRPYAGEVTKEYLKKIGIEFVSTDGTEVIRNGKEVKISTNKNAKKPYRIVTLDDPEIGKFTLGVHVLNYVWNRSDKALGKVIHHQDNDPTNNDIDNLKCVTQKQNLAYEHPDWNTGELKCDLSKPRSFYEKKLEGYECALEQAKQMHDSEGAHHLRTNISQTRKRLNYYDNHIEEYLAKSEEKRIAQDCHARAQKRRELKYQVDRARLMYLELKEAYGADDPIVEQYWGEWKVAVAMLQGFIEKNKRASQ